MLMTEEGRRWVENLQPGGMGGLFEHLPNLLYFAKDAQLRLMAGNRAFVERCGFRDEAEMVGHWDREIFPPELAEKYRQDDRRVIASGEALTGIVELFPNRVGEPEWFITDKIPLFDREGAVAGLCGTVRSYEGAREELQPYLDLMPVTEYLKAHHAEKVAVGDLAKLAGMSVRHLERRFRETFKTTIRAYVMKLRVLEACELLANSGMLVTEIALRVGFYDHSAFSRKFSELMGVTPRGYRKRFAGSGG
jgi:AraC-like DNA-binding protein